MKSYQLDVVVTRGSSVESRHRVHAAIVDLSGRLVGGARDPQLETAWRSCAKPFQAMPLVASGGFDQLRWGDDELALACASHGGEPEHVAIAGAMLDTLELEEGDLACGPHDPLSARGARILRETGSRPTRLHNNCSGKHAAMLGRAQVGGWQMQGYEREGHPVQDAVLAEVARWSAIPAERIGRGVDGCGAVVFSLPLEAMARAYARLAKAVQRAEEIPTRIVSAMRTRPFLIGGTDRFDTVLLEETDGGVLAKVGAEGVHSVAVLADGLGIAVKVEDGGQRAQYPAVLRILQHVGALPEVLSARLAEFASRPVKSTRGDIVGEIRPLE
ncbi:MAG: asparaginase [Gemmatimonadaceae bacterium]